MSEIDTLERLLWGFTFLLNVGLIFLVLYRKNYRVYPFFFIYAVSAVLQNIAFFVSYRIWGFNSLASFWIAWGSQALVTVARAFAVAEVCRHVLAQDKSIWAFGWRVLLGVGALVFACSWAFGLHSWRFILVTTDGSFELALALVIVVLYEMARRFCIEPGRTLRLLMAGLFLYSGYRALADMTLERSQASVAVWNYMGTVAFLLSSLLWTWGLRQPATKAAFV